MPNEQKVKVRKFYQNSSRPSNYVPNALVTSPPEYPPLMSGLMQINPETKDIWISAGREFLSDWINITAGGGGGGGVTSIDVNGGTGISVTPAGPITTSGAFTVVNTAPDLVVSLTSGTGIGITGVYPNFTISSTAYSTIQEDGSGLTSRSTVNFVGTGVTATDDGGNLRTNVTIPGITASEGLSVVTGDPNDIELGRIALAATADFSVSRFINAGTNKLVISGDNNSAISGANPILEINNTYAGPNSSQALRLNHTGGVATVNSTALYIRAGLANNNVIGIDLSTNTNQASASFSQTGTGNTVNASASTNISGIFSSAAVSNVPAIMSWKTNGSNTGVDNVLQINKSMTAAVSGSGAAIFYSLKTTGAGSQNRLVGRVIYAFEGSAAEGSYSAKYSVSVVDNTAETTRFEMYGSNIIRFTQGLSEYADDAAAAAGGIPVNALYRTGSFIKIRVS